MVAHTAVVLQEETFEEDKRHTVDIPAEERHLVVEVDMSAVEQLHKAEVVVVHHILLLQVVQMAEEEDK